LIPDPPKNVFWQKVWSAIQRAIALIVFKGVHLLLDYVLNWNTPPDMVPIARFMDDALWIVFNLVYVYLCWEMLAVFIPWLRRKD
jgi:hypothetical protein